MSAAPVLAVENLFAGYEPGAPIVRGASIHVAQGEIVAILGPNGAGKSTLIKAIAGLVPKFSGRVTMAGDDITALPVHRIVRHGLAFVPQTENVFARMTVADNLALKSALGAGCFYVGALGSRKTHAKRVDRLLGMGVSEGELARIHSPIGMDIGAATPAEIAVAVLAEIISAFRSRGIAVEKTEKAA